MKKVIIVALGLTMVLVLISIAALAQGPGLGRGFGPGPGYGPGPFIPNLTPEQPTKIQSLQQAHLQAIAPLQQELLAKETELRSLSLNPNADPAVITAKQKEIWDLQSKLQEMTNNLRGQIREVLTPEQQSQFDNFDPGREFGPGLSDRGGLGNWGGPGFPERSPGK